MPSCQCCNLKESKRLKLDRELVRGKSYTKVANEFGLDPQAVRRHSLEHLSYQLKTAYEAKAETENMDLLNEIETLIHETKDIFRQAKEENKLNVALNAIGQARGSYELLSKIAFSLHQARLAELEMERMNQQEVEQDLSDGYKELLQILNDAELKLFVQLITKINEQTDDVIVEEEPKFIESSSARELRRELEDSTIDIYSEEPEEEPAPKMKRTRKPKNDQRVRPVPSKTIRNLDDDNKAEIQRKKEKKAGPLL